MIKFSSLSKEVLCNGSARFCDAACLWLFLSFTPGKAGTEVRSCADVSKSREDACEAHSPLSPDARPGVGKRVSNCGAEKH